MKNNNMWIKSYKTSFLNNISLETEAKDRFKINQSKTYTFNK